MKVKKLAIKNIGIIADTTLELDQPLILFYGDLMQGKSTLLNAIKYAFGGSYPSDIIRHGEQEASVAIWFDECSISRTWYRSKEGHVADRPISFIRDGLPVNRPVEQIKRFLNPFLLDNEYILNRS
ncbi:MAG: AAA family ATPase [Syntrophobacteraceae bacterium]